MKPLLIVNPRSGGGQTGASFDKMRAAITRAMGDFDVAMTERPRHASEIAHHAAHDGRETVVAVGGDGSIHEVVSGLMRAREDGANATHLGVIGQGTGGDFRKSLGIEHRLDRYGEVIAAGSKRLIDVGRIRYLDHEGREASGYFVNILSIGLGGLVDRYVAESKNRFGGTVGYFLASARGLIDSVVGRVACKITLDGETHEEEIATRSMAICNGRFFGGGMEVAPMAKLEDGVFDVVDLGGTPRFKFAMVNTKIYSAEHLRDPSVRHFRCEKIEMRLLDSGIDDRFSLDVDGEPLGCLPLTIEAMPQALEVLAP